ncbi:hypothetical protein [Phenylobacterium sp.]|uniref:hypothetical protein n=1 Tax=Phenylobacterium sp. TaxID=1871053 RepID=UPI0025EBD8FE|nr:hypothetical protein [Phenylobacterium sp.]MCA3741472.1 hypothetical protein [Phenylobacterium sp.]
MRPVAIITTVWGRSFIDFYKNHVLPFTKSILPNEFLILVGTTTNHVEEMREITDIVFDCGIHENQSKYSLASIIDKTVMRFAYENGFRRFVIQNPDSIISESALIRIANTKCKVITLPGIRISKENLLMIYKGFDNEILENALTVLHPATLALARHGGYRRFIRGWPSVVYDIRPNRVRCQALHRHPLMFEIPEHFDWDIFIDGTLDFNFIQALGYPISAYDNLTASDQGYILEFSGADHVFLEPEPDVDIDIAIAEFAASQYCDDLHRWYLETEYEWRPRLKTGETRGENP